MSRSKSAKDRCLVDTNIWLYAFIETEDSEKTKVANSVIRGNDLILTSQIINETCVNLLKKAAFKEKQIQSLILSFYQKYTVLEIDKQLLLEASKLRESYSFSFWDSVVVSSAICSHCRILYSEDMQDGLKIGKQVTIINPFKEDILKKSVKR